VKVRNGDLWGGFVGGAPYATVITTNGDVNEQHEAVMGRGVAAQAAKMFPEIKRQLGRLLEVGGNHCYVLPVMRQHGAFTVSFPVKRHWSEKASLDLIDQSCLELVLLADVYRWTKVYLPRPGCGNGKLKWEDVRPILRDYFDDRFVVCYDERYEEQKRLTLEAKRANAKPVVKKGAISKAAAKRMASK
jgi:hypothetical protein